ncbi:NAD(P)/FAD-dependent oxidoreductase [Corynebacterium comes]|uniref:Rhodocoxin reductase n=1 Tax=Corynebacterium comes TaxID=2675218 RepID=A0A6B8VS22_9CORY|nr:FAD/NAD(P)-binding oxidoreductase [Corynebacterium comes]QGU04154.1 Rhodocoxin reductase [Corynebacterium comes]
MSTVIIGAGHGGVQVAESLRAGGLQQPITILDSSPELPYQRPPLSKDYMKVDFEAAPLPIREEGFYTDNDITLLRGTTVTSIDRESCTVHAGDNSFSYENLVIATGARPRTLNCEGADATNVHTLKTLQDAVTLKSRISEGSRVVVVGAGFIGMEFAVAALKHGCEVTVLEFADRPMSRAVTPYTSQRFKNWYAEHGITMRFGEGLESLEKDASGQATTVISTTGRRYEADLFVVGIGVQPNVEIADEAELRIGNGIIVDQHLRTSDPRIFAIGDCASFPLLAAHTRTRLESVQNATDQGKHVAQEILGVQEPYSVTPWFWSTQGRYRLQMTGVIHPDDDITVIGDPDKKKFSVLAFREGELVGAESVNQPADQNIVRRMFTENIPLSLHHAQAEDFDLRDHLKKAISAAA